MRRTSWVATGAVLATLASGIFTIGQARAADPPASHRPRIIAASVSTGTHTVNKTRDSRLVLTLLVQRQTPNTEAWPPPLVEWNARMSLAGTRGFGESDFLFLDIFPNGRDHPAVGSYRPRDADTGYITLVATSFTVHPMAGHYRLTEVQAEWKDCGTCETHLDWLDLPPTIPTCEVRWNTHLAFDASPEPIAKGRAIKVRGRLTRLTAHSRWSWNDTFEGYRGAHVTVYFNPTGAGPRRAMGHATTDHRGYFARSFRASTTGTWSARFSGSAKYARDTSRLDRVVVTDA